MIRLALKTLLLAASLIGLPAMAQSWQIPKPSADLIPNPAAGKPLFEKY